MNSTGGPLTYRDKPLLFNTVTSDDLAYFTDSVKTIRMLWFKKYGITLPAKEVTGGSLIGSWSVSSNYPGSTKMVNVVINPPCPCEDCNFQYALGIVGEIENPGIFNSQWAPETRTYAGYIPAVGSCSGTNLGAADITTIEDDLIHQISIDNGGGAFSSSAPDANSPGGPGAVVWARKYYIVKTTDYADSAGFTLTHNDGTTTVYAYDANSTAGAWGVNFNATTTAIAVQTTEAGLLSTATLNGTYMAIRLGTDTYMITTIQPGLLFSIGTMVNMTIEEKGINLKAKSKKEMFYVNFDKGFCTTYGLYWFEVTDSATTFDQNGLDLSIYVNGVDHNETNSTGAGTANAVTDINVAQQTSHGVYASAPTTAGNGSVIIASIAGHPLSGLAAANIWVELDSTSTATYAIAASTPTGSFERLSNDDVWREFSQLPFDGPLRSQHRVPSPTEGATFNKYTIRCQQGTYGLHGASHGATYLSEIVCYVNKAYASTFETVLTNWLS